jgi:hypothetical protein
MKMLTKCLMEVTSFNNYVIGTEACQPRTTVCSCVVELGTWLGNLIDNKILTLLLGIAF